mmetsp:Transcript_26973/g.41102  ORF Transcript_26973/g.41102 Transcript_26973/m.41102 type:complete len:161 (-) Transcript_26973:685-1167(-)
MAFILMFMIFFGILGRFLNGSLCIRMRHSVRIWFAAHLTLFSFLLISFACFAGLHYGINLFYLAVAASVFTGLAEASGEAALLGYMKGFPANMVSEVSSGSGFGGITATLALLGTKAIGMQNWLIFLVCAPVYLAYNWIFQWVDRHKQAYPFISEDPTLT